jgi:ribosomal protein S20
MADVASLAVGIAALYSACRECITIFIDWRHFEEKLTTTRRHLNIQASIFNSWGFYWELLPVDGNVEDQDSKRTFLESRSKLRTYIERSQNRYKLKGIEEALVAVAEMFCDIDKLLTKYGIQTNTVSMPTRYYMTILIGTIVL